MSSVEAIRQESIYEYLTSLSKQLPQHFVDKFDGFILNNDRWLETNSVGTATFEMFDGFNDGFRILTSALSDDSNINFGDRRQYDNVKSFFVGEFNANNGNTLSEIGLQGGAGAPAGVEPFFRIRVNRNATNIQGLTRDGGGATVLDLGVAVSSAFVNGSALITSSAGYFFLDGVLVGTITTNLPSARLQPMFRCFTISGTNAEARIRYFEAFNL